MSQIPVRRSSTLVPSLSLFGRLQSQLLLREYASIVQVRTMHSSCVQFHLRGCLTYLFPVTARFCERRHGRTTLDFIQIAMHGAGPFKNG